jgi:hypothetical protein
MLELEVTLDFDCCNCSGSIGVKVKCEGKGLATGLRTVADFYAACPYCGAVNHVCFEPSGRVRLVERYTGPRQVPQPSLN